MSAAGNQTATHGSTLVIGCGNPLRGDDGVGPEIVRRLARCMLPEDVRCVDAGTSGIDAVLAMRGADRVVVVDASCSGLAAGTIREIEIGPSWAAPAAGLAVHSIRWDHAVALGQSLLGEAFPRRVTAVLVEGRRFGAGDDLSPEVVEAIAAVVERLAARVSDGVVPQSLDRVSRAWG